MDDRNATDATDGTDGVDDAGADAATPETDEDGDELPADVVDEAERLTRLERRAIDDGEREAYAERRETLLDDHGYTSRVREETDDVTLVLHPEEWLEEGVIRTDRIEDLSRAAEIPLEGTGDPDDWDAVEERNREIAREVAATHGDVHGANAVALADFMSNHYAKPIESATAAELEEFRSDYFVRNAWPSEKQRAVVDESIELVYETVGEPVPGSRVQ